MIGKIRKRALYCSSELEISIRSEKKFHKNVFLFAFPEFCHTILSKCMEEKFDCEFSPPLHGFIFFYYFYYEWYY